MRRGFTFLAVQSDIQIIAALQYKTDRRRAIAQTFFDIIGDIKLHPLIKLWSRVPNERSDVQVGIFNRHLAYVCT